MKLASPRLDRRTLLIGGGAGVGLVVAWALWPRREAPALLRGEGEHVLGHYLKIGRDGRVTVAVPQAETGQGAWTALPQIAADELGAAWEMVGVEPAPLAPIYANRVAEDEGWLSGLGTLREWGLPEGAGRLTARSSSVRAFERPLRQAAAAARAMLVRAAADRWDVNPAECDAADGFVTHEGKRAGFGELADAAARFDPPDDAPLRRAGSGALAGRPLPRLDLPAKSDGSLRFAGDVRLPDMLFASARLAPPGGRLTAFSRTGAEAAPGVRAVVPANGWLAVAADSWWAAERGLKAAAPRFEAPAQSGADLRDLFQAELDGGALETMVSRGDHAGAVEGSRPLAATYWAAPAAHLGLEPLTATARFTDDRLEVWAPTQAPEFARRAAEREAGGASHVTLYPMPVGEPGGRALEADAIPVAVALARRLGRPVQVTLPAAASQSHDRPASAALAQVSALPGAGGGLAAWRMRLVTSDGFGAAVARLAGADGTSGVGNAIATAAVPPYAVPNLRIDLGGAPLPFAPGYMRGEPERTLTFFTESFLDELARRLGNEPLAYRMGLLGGRPRLARCLATAAASGGWDGGGPGSNMGLAAAASYGSFIGLLAEASVGGDQRIQVHRLVACVDCGRIANAGLVRQQVESGLIWALGQATVRAPSFAGGLMRARPYGVLGLPRMAGTPDIRVELVPSSADPGGVSGLAPSVLAPAVANAVFAGTGIRLRSLPFDLAAE